MNFFEIKDNHKIFNFLIFKAKFKIKNTCLSNIYIFDDKGCYPAKQPIQGLSIALDGKNNTVKIHKSAVFKKCKIKISSNNSCVEISKNSKMKNVHLLVDFGDNQKFFWGENSIIYGGVIRLCEENSSISIGKNCLFSFGQNIWSSDGHTILNDKMECINYSKGKLEIADNCWIGLNSIILKNTKLYPNTVVGAGSVLSKDYKKGSIILAGNPAKIIKENIGWKNCNPKDYIKES